MKRKLHKRMKLWALYDEKENKRILLCKHPLFINPLVENKERHREITSEILEILDQINSL